MLGQIVYLAFIGSAVFVSFLAPNSYLFWFVFLLIWIPTLTILPSIFTAPYVPTEKNRMAKMIETAGIKPKDVVYDMGAGDGRLVLAAANRGAKATGIEISLPLVWLFNMKNLIVRTSAKMEWGSCWNRKYEDADVIFCYLLPKGMTRFAKEIYPELKKGSRVVSNYFPINGLKAERQEDSIYLYIK